MSGLLELAERCEKAVPDVGASLALVLLEDEVKRAVWALGVPPQRFLHSLDAALDLVPEGALYEVEHKINIGIGKLFEHPKGEPETDFRAGVGVGDKAPLNWSYGRSFATPALALCAAALRARASQSRDAA